MKSLEDVPTSEAKMLNHLLWSVIVDTQSISELYLLERLIKKRLGEAVIERLQELIK